HAAFVFPQNLDRTQQVDDDDRNKNQGRVAHFRPPDSSDTGSTVSLSLSIAVIRTGAPAATGRAATAFQYSPRTNTLPSGASSVSAEPVVPIIPSVPVATLLCRARTTSESSMTVITENGSASPIAVLQWIRISGIGPFTRIIAPITMATAPPIPRIPCDVNFASSTKSVNANKSSPAPSQLIGRTDKAESPKRTMMAPTIPGAISPGDENST